MTFLRKRSRSQCSSSTCDDDRLLNKRTSTEVRRHAASNTRVTARDFDLNDSCVLRNFPKHKSGHLRFLAWVQYTRQFPDYPITDEERRTCPLLWCRATFHDQDTMLKHVWSCDHLEKGLYWCFQCQKPERVGRFQCRRCQGGSSTTDRIATVARRIFTALGTRRGRERPTIPLLNEGKIAVSDNTEPCPTSVNEEEIPSYWDPPYLPELPNNIVSEMENSYIIPEMADTLEGHSWDLTDHVTESTLRSEHSISTNTNPTSTKQNVEFYETWNFTHFGEPVRSESPRPSRSILPRLNTKTLFDTQKRNMNCVSNLQHLNNPQSPTFVSPLSATGGHEFRTFGSLDISPTDSEASGLSLFTDSGYSSATIESSWNGSSFTSVCPEESKKEPEDPLSQFNSYKSMERYSASKITPHTFPSLFEMTEVNMMTSSSMAATHSASRCDVERQIKQLSPHWSDAQSLVACFGEVLNEHLQHSRAALDQMASNPITRELLSLSLSSIISIGLDVLAGLLEGRSPTSTVHLFSFSSVAYALAIAVDHASPRVHTQKWFQDSLFFIRNLTSERLRQSYTQIARIIWQPRSQSTCVENMGSSSSMPVTNSDENSLIRACKEFLDVQQSFEYSENSSKASASASQFNFVQASFSNRIKSHKIIDRLIQRTSIEAFIEDVVEVEKRLSNGLISDIRQLELELICNAKLVSQSDSTLERFQNHVIQLCDSFRSEDMSCKSRTSHHLETIESTRRLVPQEEENCDDKDEDLFDFYLNVDLPDSGYSTLDTANSEEIQEMIEIFKHDADSLQTQSTVTFDNSSFTPEPHTLISSGTEKEVPVSNQTMETTLSPDPYQPFMEMMQLRQSLELPSATSFTLSEDVPSTTSLITPTASSQANKYRCHCGYEPLGSEEWKASNFARHKRTQHSTPKLYRCHFPDCSAKYKRSDNLRAHLRSKGHGDEAILLDIGDDKQQDIGKIEDEQLEIQDMKSRPSKRRRKGGAADVGKDAETRNDN